MQFVLVLWCHLLLAVPGNHLPAKPRLGTHPSKMSLTRLPKELEASGPSISHEIAWSLLHITLLGGAKIREDRGPGYASGEGLGVRNWGSGWRPY